MPSLRAKFDDLEKILEKFTNESKGLDMVLRR